MKIYIKNYLGDMMADFEIEIKNEHLATFDACFKLRNKFNQLLNDITDKKFIQFEWVKHFNPQLIGSKIIVMFEPWDYDIALVLCKDLNLVDSIYYEFNKPANNDRVFYEWSYIPTSNKDFK